MTVYNPRARRGLARASLAAALAGAALFSATPAGAGTIVNFCSGTFGGYSTCSRQASFSLNAISTVSYGVSAQCVYRGSNNSYVPPSASGDEYCTTHGQYGIVQNFHGLTGNPAVHNRHSYNVYLESAYDRN